MPGASIATNSITEHSFFDTNILVQTDDADAPDKRERVLRLWQDHRIAGRAVIPVQVLKEYYVASTRKLGVDPRIAVEKLELFGRADVVRDGGEDVVRAARLTLEHRLSFWDAIIVAAAASARCTLLYSEDL